jgi:hypothetical protein
MIVLEWEATGAQSVKTSGSDVLREFGRVVQRRTFTTTSEQARVTGTLNGVTVTHLGSIVVQTGKLQ